MCVCVELNGDMGGGGGELGGDNGAFLVFGGLIYVVASKQRKTAKKDMLYQHRERKRGRETSVLKSNHFRLLF